MFRSILCLSICTLPVAAFADISVGDENSPFKVYGVLDYGINYSHSDVQDSHEFQSGMDYASRLGLKLNLKLNDDLSIIGNAESMIDLRKMEFVRKTTFARAEYLGLQSKQYGTLVYGRVMPAVAGALEELFAAPFTPTAIAIQAYDLGAGAPNYDFRTSRAVSYTTPTFKNTSLTMLYSPNQMVGEGSYVTDAKNYGILAIYDDGVNRVSGSYNELISNFSVNYKGEILSDVKTKDYRALVLRRMNKNLTLIGTAGYFKPDSPHAASAQVYGAAINFEQPKYSLKASVYRRDVDQQDRSAMVYSAGANYHINKHLDAYIRAAYVDNNENSFYTINDIALSGAGDDPSTYGVGLKFSF
ncbi:MULTISPECIES: porin [Acinetobacter]|uniref:porin n=1 Tax=Acinetobacter TaxID=469 RepID=UPI00079FF1D2|nr:MULTISPECIES: porin [unclassified Acinetobacter]KYQ84360.1 hypothetical protein AWW72_09225 [Acinetobacter sp. NRRL B-65365]OEC87181.1 hypothetical protein A9Z07_10955 [Acinetobacter sp. YK3]